jgi:Tfp pilus assembly protein PilW
MNQGLTLIETIIYISIIGIVVTSFVGFSISVSDSRNKTYSTQEVQSNMRVAVDLISQKVRSASGVDITNSNFDTHPGYLILTVASTTLNPTIIGLDTTNNTLGIKEGILATTSITSDEVNVSNLVFTNLTSSSTRENIRTQITIDFANSSTPQFTYSQSVQSATSLRQ